MPVDKPRYNQLYANFMAKPFSLDEVSLNLRNALLLSLEPISDFLAVEYSENVGVLESCPNLNL